MAAPQGVSIAFGSGPLVVNPTWTRLDKIDGLHVQSWSISRGRPTEFEQVGAGTATVRIVDELGLLDPTNGFSTYFGDVLPDKQAAIALYDPVQEEWQTIFRGYIDEINYELDLTRSFLRVDLQLVDAFGWLTDAELMPGEDGVTPTPKG